MCTCIKDRAIDVRIYFYKISMRYRKTYEFTATPREELVKIDKFNDFSPNLQGKFVPIDWLVWYNFHNR